VSFIHLSNILLIVHKLYDRLGPVNFQSADQDIKVPTEVSFQSNTSMCTKVVVNNGGCITSHNKRGEQAFIQNILENNY
jgi:hypothetical protein